MKIHSEAIVNRAFILLSIMYVSGCSGVASLPYYTIDRSGNQVETLELCILYFRYGFLEGGVESCDGIDWTLKRLNGIELRSDEYRSRRNELQHTILGLATDACTDYKKRLANNAEGWMVGTTILAIFLSAGATVRPEILAKELAAAATAVSGTSQILEESYMNDLENAQLGIELARTRVFRNILSGQDKNLIDYPLSRAVNDAMRYHGVCNRSDGRFESLRALSSELEELSN